MEYLMLVLTICIIVSVFGLGLPLYINKMVDLKVKTLEEAILQIATKQTAQDENTQNLVYFCNTINYNAQVDRWNFQNHMYTKVHGIREKDNFVHFETEPAMTDHEYINFRSWGMRLNQVGADNGYIPRQDYPLLGGAEITHD